MSASRPAARVALVGCGAVAEVYYAPALRELSKEGLVRVTALADTDRASAERLARRFPAAQIQEDLGGLESESVDLAVVASPPRFHAAQSIELLGRGVSVLCEKPMAASVEEGEAMLEAASSSRRVLAVGLVRRYLPACETIRTAASVAARR